MQKIYLGNGGAKVIARQRPSQVDVDLQEVAVVSALDLLQSIAEVLGSRLLTCHPEEVHLPWLEKRLVGLQQCGEMVHYHSNRGIFYKQ